MGIVISLVKQLKIKTKKGIKQRDLISRMQIMGCNINPTGYSKFEGQIRIATVKEVFATAKILNVSIDSLFLDEEKE